MSPPFGVSNPCCDGLVIFSLQMVSHEQTPPRFNPCSDGLVILTSLGLHHNAQLHPHFNPCSDGLVILPAEGIILGKDAIEFQSLL